METLSEAFVKSFTRYFIPGLILLVIGLYLPLSLFAENEFLNSLSLLDFPQFLVFGIVLGYLMDSLGAYRFTLSYPAYRRRRREFAQRSAGSDSYEASSDPDLYLSNLWHWKEKLYDRLMIERAEWVMILESSCVMLVAGIVILAVSLFTYFQYQQARCLETAIAVILLALSYVSSAKGIQRMEAHNSKVIYALDNLTETATPEHFAEEDGED